MKRKIIDHNLQVNVSKVNVNLASVLEIYYDGGLRKDVSLIFSLAEGQEKIEKVRQTCGLCYAVRGNFKPYMEALADYSLKKAEEFKLAKFLK